MYSPMFSRSLRVLALNSSPRVGSTVCLLVDRMLAILDKNGIETEHIQFGREVVAGCHGCDPPMCREGDCFQYDDIINALNHKMRHADGIILASPLNLAGVNSNMKALIDRCGCAFMACFGPELHPLRRKAGVGIGVHRHGGVTTVIPQLTAFFMMAGIIVPGSTYWNCGAEAKEDPSSIGGIEDLTSNLEFLMRCTAGRKSE
eukprot:TRINITY_DN37423_c0_g1_i1.p1 TRINITY_DN37423_c0_g1~~TRINITY_DN37423_c0_g1_i1.p1  ORF type:complete len:210 (+),score=47.17 TRINITY_DN37423_c0_g1_i1:23-631(+)